MMTMVSTKLRKTTSGWRTARERFGGGGTDFGLQRLGRALRGDPARGDQPGRQNVRVATVLIPSEVAHVTRLGRFRYLSGVARA